MEKAYDFKGEKKIYEAWEKSGGFRAPLASEAKKKKQKPFTIIMPPPNANDPLHVGHAMFVTVEDILIRYHRMKGDATLWLPGTDHAGIETQYVFEKKLAKDGKSRFDFDRETLYKMIWDYVQENSGVAIEQMKRLGASADWERFKFTLDPEVVDLVLDTFIKLNEDGLIYRGERLVNYCTRCGTSYSELEVNHEEREGKLYFIRYPLVEGGEIVVATTRPETMLGDTAVAVNPTDKRYKSLVGRTVKLPLVGREIPVIADKAVDKEFGTGAVKVTPAHDQADWEMGERHELPRITVIGTNGKMTDEAGEWAGLRVEAAREAIVERLETDGLLVKTESHKHNVGVCYRCGRVIEPLPLAQFFIKVKPLAEKALKALDKKETVILGAGREKILRHWLRNLKDWNISRQIVWGIRLPVWYKKGDKTDYVVSKTSPGKEYEQETDTFDTWFSSGQWPVATLKTGEKGDFEFYYPTTVMETAYDILTFWVMRMMLLSIYLTGESPFKYVYLHGLVRDEQGRKMSKSIGNVINPVSMVERYGADAIRMALVMSSTAGTDKNVGESQIRGMRNFANKIWNAARFVEMLEGAQMATGDESFREKMKKVTLRVAKQLEELKVGLAAETVYNEFWHWYCDEAIEQAKQGQIGTEAIKEGLVTFLKLLHPFVPFVTEAVWQEMQRDKNLMMAAWPEKI